MGVGIGTCCCDCQTSLNYVFVRPDLPINLQVIRFNAYVKDFDSVTGLQYCTYGPENLGATFVYQETVGDVHVFRQYNQWTGYDPGDRPPLNASIVDNVVGISTTYESVAGMTWVKKSKIKYVEFRRIYGASSATDYTYRIELNDTEIKLVKVSGTCGCIRKTASANPQQALIGNQWIYPPTNWAQLRLFPSTGSFDPIASKTFTMTISGLTSPWNIMNFSGATLSFTAISGILYDGFGESWRFDGTSGSNSIVFQAFSVRETSDVDIVNTTGSLATMGSIQITNGSNLLVLIPSNLATSTKSPDDGSDWSAVEWKAYSTYAGFGTPPDVTGVSVTITETP